MYSSPNCRALNHFFKSSVCLSIHTKAEENRLEIQCDIYFRVFFSFYKKKKMLKNLDFVHKTVHPIDALVKIKIEAMHIKTNYG